MKLFFKVLLCLGVVLTNDCDLLKKVLPMIHASAREPVEQKDHIKLMSRQKSKEHGIPLIFPGQMDHILFLNSTTNQYYYDATITCDEIAEAF